MNWLARLKTGKTPKKDAAKTTETLFVVSVAPILAPFQKHEESKAAANDPAPTPMTATVDIGTVRPTGLSPLLSAASLALDASIVAAGTLPSNDPDGDCWPRCTAMNGTEIDFFTARLHRFTNKGLTSTDGEALADRLTIRDREKDDRQLCLECGHLMGYGATSWRCGNPRVAGLAFHPRHSQLSADLVLQFQRCDGLTLALSQQGGIQ